jgi:hypothetical protein
MADHRRSGRRSAKLPTSGNVRRLLAVRKVSTRSQCPDVDADVLRWLRSPAVDSSKASYVLSSRLKNDR